MFFRAKHASLLGQMCEDLPGKSYNTGPKNNGYFLARKYWADEVLNGFAVTGGSKVLEKWTHTHRVEAGNTRG